MALSKNRWILSVVVLLSCVVLPNCGSSGGSSSDSGGGSGSNSGGLTVSTISPLDAATGVAAGTNIVATFSSSIDETTLAGNFTLTCGGTSVTGTITYDAANKQATFDPASDLTEGAVCTVTLSAGIKTSGGVALTAFSPTFTVTTTALAVSSVKDTAGNTISTTGSTISPDNTTLAVTFSKSMDESTISTSTLTLSCNGTSITGTVSKVSATEFSFTYSNQPQNDCTFTIVGGASGIKDISGNTMSADATYTTGSACDADDEFDSDDISACWTQQNASNMQTPSISGGRLNFSFSATNDTTTGTPCIVKSIAGDFAVSIYVNNSDTITPLLPYLSLRVSEASDATDNFLSLSHGKFTLAGRQPGYYDGSTSETRANVKVDAPIFLCIQKDGDTLTGQYATTVGGSWTAFSSVTVTTGNTAFVGICGETTLTAFTFQTDWIKFDFSSDPSCTTE